MILTEGGNVFDGTTDFDHSAIDEILKTVNASLEGTGIEAIPVGSAATPTPGKTSGDLDVIVDAQAVMDYFDVRDAKQGRKALNDYIAAKGFEVAQTGTNVHVRAPNGDQSHQVDIMVVANAPTVAKFHKHDIPADSPYKGKHKQLLLAMIAKDKGYLWSAWQGLFKRLPNGKKDPNGFVSDNLDEIAKVLLNPNATAQDLGSAESILAALPSEESGALLQRAEQDKQWTAAPKESQELGRIKELAGL